MTVPKAITDIRGLIFYVGPDDIMEIDENGGVAQCGDFAQADPARRPKLAEYHPRFGGEPALVFDGEEP